ncbi:MAG: hypothetical protein ACRDHZ_12960 [Ktedonobacteraceae bacterium]
MSKSEIALFCERQALEEASARLGLDGLAQVASHEAINARAERGAARILQLVEQGHHAQAVALMDRPDWGADEGEM